ncbi:glycosyltransferase family 2 protein [Microvirga sp. 2MCAF38]|uniref:glycosyltransferase family 2 protein n=1 Tax=Microvirga sp. 2MCAF38 TaxID=3232989 RepID=UPI003F97245A
MPFPLLPIRLMVPAMISVLIRVRHGPEALAVTLSALVPAVAAGLVGDAVILSDGPDDIIAAVVDAAGAELIVAAKDPWRQGAQIARRDWLLCLDDGDVLAEGWINTLERFAAFGRPDRSGKLKRKSSGLFAGVTGLVRAFVAGDRSRAGDLVHKQVLLGQVKARSTVSLAAFIERDPFFTERSRAAAS